MMAVLLEIQYWLVGTLFFLILWNINTMCCLIPCILSPIDYLFYLHSPWNISTIYDAHPSCWFLWRTHLSLGPSMLLFFSWVCLPFCYSTKQFRPIFQWYLTATSPHHLSLSVAWGSLSKTQPSIGLHNSPFNSYISAIYTSPLLALPSAWPLNYRARQGLAFFSLLLPSHGDANRWDGLIVIYLRWLPNLSS